MTMPTHAPLSALSIDNKVNARTVGRGAEPEFAASIRAVGVIEPLVVRQPNGTGHYTITNGSKRFDALVYLRDKKESAKGIAVTDAYPVPIVVRQEDDAQARETSLMTHVIRTDLHPVEEFRAFSNFYQDVRKQKLPHDDAVLAIAKRFGLAAKYVEQSLALANLDDTILDAWVKGEIEQDAAQAFTLCPDKKSQATIFAKLAKQGGDIRRSDVKSALKINFDNPGKLLNAVGIEAYEKRGGKVTRDLFGGDHIVSDAKLAKAMSIEAIDAKCIALIADGWAWARPADGVANRHTYGQVGVKPKPTPEEEKKLSELGGIADDWNLEDDEQEAASAEYDELKAAIDARAYTAEHKAKSGCFVSINQIGNISVDYGRVKPEERKAIQAQERAAEKKKKAKSGAPEEPKDISGALAFRLSQTVTRAAYEAIKSYPALALTFAIAALQANGHFAGGDVAIKLVNSGMLARESDEDLDFLDTYKRVAKMKQPEQLKLLAAIVGTAFDFVVHDASQSPLLQEGDSARFICNEIDARTMNKTLRAAFDAKDYFDSVPKALCLAAITEAVNGDEARKVAGKPKSEIAAFAIANVPKTGWLPIELRTSHYDGPTAKKAAAKKLAPKGKAAPRRKAA